MLNSPSHQKIETVGKPAMAKFLQKLQIFKSTADIKGATEFFGHYSTVDEKMLQYRPIVLARQKPRPICVQAHVDLDVSSNKVVLHEYDSSAAGLVQSFVDRFGQDADVDHLLAINQADASHFTL